MLKWDLRFMRLARFITQESWSKDPSTKVSAVLVSPDRATVILGYNGFPRGTDDSEDLYANREIKYSRVVHAELNAILNCPVRPKDWTIYVYSQGWRVCSNCAAAIIQAGITRVVYDNAPMLQRGQTSINSGMKLFREAGIRTEGIDI